MAGRYFVVETVVLPLRRLPFEASSGDARKYGILGLLLCLFNQLLLLLLLKQSTKFVGESASGSLQSAACDRLFPQFLLCGHAEPRTDSIPDEEAFLCLLHFDL